MKLQTAIKLAALYPLASALGDAPESPIVKVVTFIKALKDETEKAKDAEKAQYDKFKTWCDKVIADTTKAIDAAKETITEQETIIDENSGSGAASGAQIKYVKKNIADAEKSKSDAIVIRAKEKKAFNAGKAEMTSAIDALKKMEKELGGEEEKKEEKEGEFLQTASAAKMKRVRKAVKAALKFPAIVAKLSTEQLSSLKDFADPEGAVFLQSESQGEPASNLGGVIGMVRETREDQEKDWLAYKAEEDEKVKAHDKLVKTLDDELKDLEKQLETMEASLGNSDKALADAKKLLAQTEEELAADTKLRSETDASCKEKARQYDKRTKTRTAEIEGITKAIAVLDSDEAKATFKKAAAVGFLQTSSYSSSLSESQQEARQSAYTSLKAVASKYKDIKMAHLAMKVHNAGHFDKVIDTIDRQIKALRAEMKQDVEHRDKCQKQQADNAALLQELTHKIGKATTKITRQNTKKDELTAKLDAKVKEIAATQEDMDELEEDRAEERKKHLEALKEDKDALAILQQGIVTISEFFKDRKIEVGLIQGHAPVKAGDTPDIFSDKAYEGSKAGTGSVIGMMKIVEDDMKAEIDESKKADAEDQEIFQKAFVGLKEKKAAQKKEKVSLDKSIAAVQEEITDKEGYKTNTEAEKTAATAEKTTLASNCEWVTTQFEKRRGKRQAELDGLVEARGFLGQGNAR
eukprot:TRINITY_DN93273_c0_g1_i1.p1 TRINITY_DN93273_c0_g1~~TRINITY_DN93273_c0_g1_i1.p1  ORF type:complete len:693 (-),score=248.78 TRINITY_DN93273_c0_g1_i1:69-2147(-)